MNRELPNERIPHQGGNWQHVIIGIGNESIETNEYGTFRYWTKVTHRVGGQVIWQERCEPVDWDAHWARYRKEHPELEPYWRGP